MSGTKLNEAQELFCNYYLEGLISEGGLNSTEAYMKAYPDSKKVSAAANAARLLTHAAVKEYIQEKVGRLVMGTDEALIRLGNLARSAKNESDRIKALDLILKTKGVYIDRHDITTAGQKISWQQFVQGDGDVSAVTNLDKVAKSRLNIE